MAPVFFVSVYLLLSVVYVAGVFLGKEKLVERRLKPLLMPALLVFYLSAAHPADPLVVLALVFGFGGDVLLMVENHLVCLGLGCISFLAGHLFYAAAFVSRIHWDGFRPVMLIALVYVGFAVMALKKLWPGMDIGPGRKVVMVPVLAYMAAIAGMSFLAVLNAIGSGRPGACLCAAGSIFFITSDTVLASGFFRKTSMKAVMPTYLAAQILIVSGFLIG